MLPGDIDFVCCLGVLFTELSGVAPNADVFSGVLHYYKCAYLLDVRLCSG